MFNCWVAMLNFDVCCRGPWGEGQLDCWEGPFTWEKCCLPEIQGKNISQPQFEAHLEELDGILPPPPVSNNELGMGGHGLQVPPGSPEWLQNMSTCLTQYDAIESRRWFLAHSGVPAHFVAHIGNPGACVDGGHSFYWGLLVVQINLAGNAQQDATMSDVALEFSICVPKICQYAVVDAVLVPFYMGPYLGKPWGPNPEFLYRFKHLGGGMADPGAQTLQASASSWMAEILMRGPSYHRDFYQREWPFRRELWEYQRTWWPSPRNEMILAFLMLPPLLAGFCIFLLGRLGLQLPGAASSTPAPARGDQSAETNGTLADASTDGNGVLLKGHGENAVPTGRSSVGAAVSVVIKGFAPQTYIKELSAPVKNDLVHMHTLRIVLQVLVCWQHTILFVEWLGNSGHHGIVSFLPLTNDLARMMGRVNTTFACLTLHLSLESVVRTLRAADKRVAGSGRSGGGRTAAATPDPAKPASPAASASNGSKQKGRTTPTPQPPTEVSDPAVPEVVGSASLAAVSAPRATMVLWLWCVRRWVRQVGELGLWTFYFNEIVQDIPWKPFPDFVQVWYRDRSKSCRRWLAPHQHQLPMWLLSLFFVYEPVNSVLRLHRPPVSLCHNMQVFENLWWVSVSGAVLGTIRHLFGRRALLASAVLLAAAAIRFDPPWPTVSDADNAEGISWDEVIYSTLQMLPASITTALVLSEVFPDSQTVTRGFLGLLDHPRAHLVILMTGFALDFIQYGHAPLLADYIPIAPVSMFFDAAFRAILVAMEAVPTAAFFLREGLHALGVALLIRSFKPEEITGTYPGWARCISRLSLSVNLTNIFAIHYLRGRMLDHPVEFSHVHGILYTVWIYGAAIVASLVAHCMVAPYVSAVEAVLNRLSRWAFSSKASTVKKQA